MDGQTLTSVSKGCFVVRGKKGGKSSLDPSEYFNGLGEWDKMRWEMAEAAWTEMEGRIKSLHSNLTADIFSDLMLFIEKSSAAEKEADGKRAEIPAAALVTGVNMPDHTGLFTQLSVRIKESVTPHVALLRAKNCTNAKSTMRCIGQQLMLGESEDAHNVSVDDHDNDVQKEKSSGIWKRSIPLTMPLLEKWYSVTEHSLGPKTPKKLKKNAGINTPIIIIICDTEAFLPHLLQDLIAMFSSKVDTLHVIFIFGVATSWASVVDRQLPHSATVHLALEKFYSPSASQHLALIIDNILLTSSHPFKLSGKCMQLLLDVFLCHDFSVTNFLLMLKFSVLQHFYQEKCSVFCTEDLMEINERVDDASREILQHLRALPSIKKYLATLTTNQKNLLQTSDDEFRKVVCRMLHDLRNFHRCFYPVMRSLFALCKSLPKHPLGRHLRELYCACDYAPIVNSEDYKQAKLFLQVSSRDQLTQRLQACSNELEENLGEEATEDNYCAFAFEAKRSLLTTLETLRGLDDMQDVGSDDEKEDADGDNTGEQSLETVKYAYQLKEKLQTRAKEKKMKKMTAFEKVRMNALETLDKLYSTVLQPPRSFPLHEVYYFDSTSAVKRHMIAAPRLAIQTSLSDPRCYLQQSCLDAIDGVIPPFAPDVCIAYKLHNECGRIINLYDWLQAFHTVVTSKEDSGDKEEEEIDDVTQARFIRAASELQFLGFIKPTKKKTDHVQRLTWSHS